MRTQEQELRMQLWMEFHDAMRDEIYPHCIAAGIHPPFWFFSTYLHGEFITFLVGNDPPGSRIELTYRRADVNPPEV